MCDEGVCKCRGSPALRDPANRPPAAWPARGRWEAGPAPSLSVWTAAGARRPILRPIRAQRQRLRLTATEALVDSAAPLVATAAGCRVFGRGLADGDHWKGLGPYWGPSAAAVRRCRRSVQGAVGRALSSAQERVRKRCGWARRGIQACSRSSSPQTGWQGQGAAAHPQPTREKNVRVLLLLSSTLLLERATLPREVVIRAAATRQQCSECLYHVPPHAPPPTPTCTSTLPILVPRAGGVVRGGGAYGALARDP